jgi:hypothetical protein
MVGRKTHRRQSVVGSQLLSANLVNTLNEKYTAYQAENEKTITPQQIEMEKKLH